MKNNNIFYFRFAIVSILIFISAQLSAQNTAVVFGKVIDTEGNPIGNVTISLLGVAQAPAYTTDNGTFEYTVPANTDITLVFSNINFTQYQRKLNLVIGERKELNHSMVFKNTIGVVEVSGEGRYQSITRLDPVNVTHLPASSQDFNAILFTLPGVSSRNELSSTYSVRGGNFDENLVYVNGIEIYRPFLTRSGQQEGLSFINPDMVSSVVFSATGSLLGSNLHLEGSSSNYRFTWTIGARYKTNRYLLGKTDTKAEYTPFFGDVQLYTTYDLTTNWQLDFLGNYASNKYQVVPQSRETDFGTFNQALRFKVYFDGQEVDRFVTTLGALSANYRSDNQKTSLKFIGSAFNSTESEAFDIQGR